MARSRLVVGAAAAVLFWAGAARAQNVSMLSSPRETTRGLAEDPIRVGVPVAAAADLGGTDQQGVAPTIGFQVWKRDNFFLGAFFSIAAADSTVKEAYGSFVLNPPLQGRSFYVSGNKMWSLRRNSASSPFVLIGAGGRVGTTSSNIEFTPADASTASTRAGFGTVGGVSVQVVSPSIDLTMGETTSEFQLGVEIGPTWRLLGGDLGEDDAFRRQVLGTERSTFRGVETTFFVRINSVQPFARFSSFGRPDGVVIRGFTGRQVVWGVNVASSLFQGKKS
jgi:opacity protein-like surface antigen